MSLVDFSFGREPVVELLAGGESAALRAPVSSFGDSCFAALRERRNLASLQLCGCDLSSAAGSFAVGGAGFLVRLEPARGRVGMGFVSVARRT